MPDYSLDNLPERARAASDAHASYIERLEELYKTRCEWRAAHRLPALGICGMGRAGKDTAAKILCEQLNIVYPRSASNVVTPVIAHMAGVSEAECWDTRHDHREFWFEACNAFRGDDYPRLVRLCLGAGDIAVGIRGKEELLTSHRQGVLTASVWIHNHRVPLDPTVAYAPSDCTLMILNWGSLEEFQQRLEAFAALFHRT